MPTEIEEYIQQVPLTPDERNTLRNLQQPGTWTLESEEPAAESAAGVPNIPSASRTVVIDYALSTIFSLIIKSIEARMSQPPKPPQTDESPSVMVRQFAAITGVPVEQVTLEFMKEAARKASEAQDRDAALNGLETVTDEDLRKHEWSFSDPS
ncbi:MAG: hypothetical protein AAB403_14655 [Planctomycetota bacterium]